MTRRFLAFVLAFLMLFSSVPSQVFATGGTEENSIVTSNDETIPESTEETVPEVTEETVPESTEEILPEVTEETVPETTEETIPEATEEKQEIVTEVTVPVADAPPASAVYNLGWDYAQIEATGFGHNFVNPTEDHLGSHVTVRVDGAPLSEGALLTGALHESTTGVMTVTADEGYDISNVVLAFYESAPFSGTPTYTESAYGLMSDGDSSQVTIPLRGIYEYLMEGDPSNIYLMVELTENGEVTAPPEVDLLGSYGSNLGWEYSNISVKNGGGFRLTDPAGTSDHIGSKVTVTINGKNVVEGTKGLQKNVLTKNASGLVNISTATGYYIEQIVLACYLPGYYDYSTWQGPPFSCITVAGDNAYEYVMSGSTPTNVNITLSELYKHANHDSNVSDYYLMIKLAPLPAPVYVGYDSGNAGSHDIAARPVAETASIPYNFAGASYVATPVTSGSKSYPTWSYPTAASTHSTLNISPEAEAEANSYGYSFAGWRLEYYTAYTPSSNVFSGDMSVGGTNLYQGTAITLTVHAKLTAIWQPMEQIEVEKVWDAESHPDSVTVNILKNGADTGIDIILNESNNWKTVINVPSKDENGNPITYTVSEDIPAGFQCVISSVTPSSSEYEYSFKLTNSLIMPNDMGSLQITGKKIWIDDNNAENIRPGSITVILYANGVEIDRQTVTAATDWAYHFDVAFDVTTVNADTVSFTIGEEAVAGYELTDVAHPTVSFTRPAVSGGWTSVTPCASLTYESASIVAAKTTGNGPVVVWTKVPLAQFECDLVKESLISGVSGIGNPSSFVFLNGKGTSTAYGISVDSSNISFEDTSKWSIFWTGTFSRGTSGGSGTTSSLTNSLANVYVGARKVWNDDFNRDGIRPAEIQVELYADGVATGNIAVMTEAGGWAAQWENLPKYKNGVKILYSVKEIGTPAGYTVSYDMDTETDTHLIINTHEIERTSITVNKAWNDHNNQDGIRPDSVVLTVYANGISTGNKVTLTAADGWTATVTNLPKNDNGTPIVYTMVEETAVGGYTAETNGTTVTNTHAPETVDIPVTKIWNDNDDQDGFRPDSITVHLLADGVEIGSKVISVGDDWKYTFTGLPKFRDGGVEIVYTVTEDAIAHYTTAITGFEITNTHIPETAELSAVKVWDDLNNQDGKRADSVIINLYGNDKSVALATATLSESNGWTVTWTGLPKYSGGMPINYSVAEIGATKGGADYSVVGAGYSIEHKYNNAAGSPFWTVATITNKHTPETVGLDVQKSWQDSDNQDGIRPASVTVELYYKIGASGEWTATGKKLELNPANEWDATFTSLPKYAAGTLVEYKVVEDAVPGYTATYSMDSANNVVTVTNTYIPQQTSVKVNKVWDDHDNQDGIRPASVTVSLYGRDKVTALATVVLDGSNDWSYTWTGLPMNYAGSAIVYTVVEDAVAGYTNTVNRTTTAGQTVLTVTNSHTTDTVSFPFTKVWDDNHDQDGIRPASVTVTLYADGVAMQTKTITAADNWKGTFTDLPKNKAGAPIVYTIGEATVAGYTSSVAGSTITNKHVPETISFTVNKIWNDNNNQDGKRPASIQFALFANNVNIQTATMTPDGAGKWSYTFTNLPKYAAGKEISYTVSEAVIGNGYTASISGLTITNSRTPETTAITVSKTWDDADNQDGIRPDTITVHLFADSTEVATKTIDATNSWSTIFEGLPVYKNGTKIVYTVTEDAVAGYTTTIDGFAITNKHVPATTDITVSKVWDDADNQDGIRPASVAALVSGSDGSSREVTLNAANSWSETLTGLPMYANGIKIVYKVSEPTVPTGYTASISGNVITNKHVPATVDIPVSKVWDDANNQDGKRPASVKVNLMADGVQVDSVVLNASNLWKHTFTGKPVFKAGAAVVYTLEEDAVAGYTADIDNATGVITNKYTPETITVVANKVWDDKDDQDGKRPTSITLHLLASGTHTGSHKTVTADALGKWEATWTDLPKYADGQLIRYTVTEQHDFDSGYYITYEHNRTDSQVTATITNTYKPEKTAITVEKIWHDTYNQDGLRPDSVTVALYADGVNTGKTATLDKNHGWVATISDLDKYKSGGQEIVYTVEEVGVPTGYTVSYSVDTYTGNKEVTNSHDVEKTSVTVSKVWNDSDNQDGIRPDGVTVTLYRNGVASTDPAHTVVLNESNSWKYTFSNLDVHYGIAVDNIYSVVEKVPAGYTAVTTGNTVDGFVITNSHETATVDVPVSKVWDDANDQDGIRPDSITVKLLADGTEVASAVLTASGNWTHTFTSLPKFSAGKEIVYTLDEVAVAGYTTVISGHTITNKHIPEEISITATKTWNDKNNQDGKRPASITLHLLADGHHTEKKAVLTPDASGNWKYTWTGLPKYAAGLEITYSVKEESIGNGYHTTIDGYHVINTYEPEKISINVWKKWVDNNDQDGIRPDSIDVTLYANGAAVKTITVTAADHWMGGFADLDRYANGKLITYTVKEKAVAGYTTVIDGTADAGFEITNTHETDKTAVSVTKVWNDENDRDGSRPNTVKVTLYRDGEAYATADLNAFNGWKYTFSDLEKFYGSGKLHLYTVEETVPAGYTAVVSGSADGGYTITNTHVPATVSIPVAKVWNDANNQDGLRPKKIVVALLADGVEVDTYTMTAADNWNHTFAGLQKFLAKDNATDPTVEIKYSIMEKDIPEGYSAAITNGAGGYTIINTHNPEIAQLNVRKVWSDFNNNDGKRPYAVVITLYENGLPTSKTLTLSDSNGWKGLWKDMPRFYDGQRISYSVVETGFYQTADDFNNGVLTHGVPSGYTVNHSYDAPNTANPTAIVTNTYTPETTGLNVQKTWDDDNNREGKRPDSVTVTLWRKIGETGTWEIVKDSYGNAITAVMSVDTEWETDILGLPRYSGGLYIYYNVVESSVDGYETPKYELDTVNNIVTITNTRKINQNVKIDVAKVWNDADNQDGIRPASVTVRLYANGIKTSSTKELTAANGWKAQWTGLYDYYKGQKIVYTVEEDHVADGYTCSITGNADDGFVITNTHTPATVTIPVFKHWNDNNNQDGMRPDSVVVTLLKNGVKTTKTMTLTAVNAWSGEFVNLDKYSNGVEVAYSIEEAKVDAYNLDASGQPQTVVASVVDGKIDITNTHVIEKTTMTAIKVWNDNNDQDGKRPASIVLHLVSNGTHMGPEYKRVLTAETGWTATWTDLDKYSGAELITYTVYEEPIVFDTDAASEHAAPMAADGYVPHYDRNSASQITVTNTYVPETTDISVMKAWNDDDNRDGIRPASVTVNLLAGGKNTGKKLVLSEENGWAASWTDLPVYENHGTAIIYTVEEETVPNGYTATVKAEGNQFVLTNTHTPDVTNVQVAKIWADENNNDGKRPDGIIVQLYANGTAVEGGRMILNGDNQWKHTYQSTELAPMYVFNQGELIRYYVSEIGYVIDGIEYPGLPDGYQGSTDVGTNGYSISITNTRAAEKISVYVSKEWETDASFEHEHPTSVEVTLLKNGIAVDTVVLNADGNWSHVWNDLYRYTAGMVNEYRVVETSVEDYTASYAYTVLEDGKSVDVVITNTFNTKEVTVQKVWEDNKDQKKLRPETVTIQLYKNGEAFGDKLILNAKNGWKISLTVPVSENGTEITWTIKEIGVPKHYTASYNQKKLTVVNTLKYEDSPATGDSSHIAFWVSMMIVSTFSLVGLITVHPYMIEDKKRRK